MSFKYLDVLATQEPHGFRVTITWTPPEARGPQKPKRFTLKTLNMNERRKAPLSVDVVEEIVLRHVRARGPRWLAMSSIRQLASEMATVFRNLSKRKDFLEEASAAGEARAVSKTDPSAKLDDAPPDAGVVVKRVSKSFFAPDLSRTTGATYCVLGPSFSGKTTLLVDGLNRLTASELEAYDAIFFFTESENAEPLEGLSQKVKDKTHVYKCFCRPILAVLKKLNDLTRNGFRFFVIFDDITTLRGEMITKMILTLRNSGISTALLIQHSKLLNPGQRQSIHHYYIFNLRTEEWIYMLNGFLATHMRDIFPDYKTARPQQLAEFLRCYMRDKVIHFDQRTDEVTFYEKSSIRCAK